MEPRKIYEEGDAYYKDGNFVMAEKCFMEVIDAGYRFADVYNKLGLIYYNGGILEKAARHFEEALAINPKYTEASLNLSVTYNELGRYELARQIKDKAKKVTESEGRRIDPFVKGKLANLHFEMGEIYQEMTLLDDAIEQYKKALSLRPDLVDVRVRMAEAYRDKGAIDKAIHEFQEAKVINPNYAPAGINLGVTYYSLSKLSLAEEEWQEVLKKHPGNKMAEMYLRLLKHKE